ncbi:MAG TPA: hypothetical protein VFR02_07160 [bacterium]|nr:hypothetical protein [bacterium]
MFADRVKAGRWGMMTALWLGLAAGAWAAAVETDRTAAAPGAAAPDEAAASPMPRVRISDNVGFYYFVSAGYVAPDPERIPRLGQVAGDFSYRMIFGTPQKVWVDLHNALVRPGDFLVVYRLGESLDGGPAGDLGRRVENLAILEVQQLDKGRCLTVVKESFAPFEGGDPVKSYGDEVVRWKQAQRRKVLPDKTLTGRVAAGPVGKELFSQGDWLVLSLGQKDGVVEGQSFDLVRREKEGITDPEAHKPVGKAQVLYVGGGYCMAQIVRSYEPVRVGDEARYRP